MGTNIFAFVSAGNSEKVVGDFYDVHVFDDELVISGNLHQLVDLRLSVMFITTDTPAYTDSILDYIVAVRGCR